LERYWKRALAEEAKSAKKAATEASKAVARDVAGRIRQHQKFAASLTKHSKALAALAH
jgi:acyl-CoA reductase-like NAD-dependent aldehyde dehydrogenase